MHRGLAAYARHESDEQSHLVHRYGGLIERNARRLVSRTGVTSAFDDLWSAGALGLVEASQRFDASRGVSFESFVSHRIRGRCSTS